MSSSVLDPMKTAAASLLNDFKDIPGKACLNGVDNNDAFVNVGNRPFTDTAAILN